MAPFKCKYCFAEKPTSAGLHLHIMQTATCRKRMEAEAASDSDSDSPPNSSNHQEASLELDEGVDEVFTFPNIEDPQLAHHRIPDESSDTPSEDSNPRRKCAWVEDADDEDSLPPQAGGTSGRWAETFPLPAGTPKGRGRTRFQSWRNKQEANGLPPWFPFKDQDDWELAQWLIRSGVTQSKINEFFSLNSIRLRLKTAFKNSRSLLKVVDQLPSGPDWSCEPLELVGDRVDAKGNPLTETLELWVRNPVECIKELLGNPSFKEYITYEPIRIYLDAAYKNREYSEMWTADLWWELQKLLPEGATVVPTIFASDKTQLTKFSGDKEAWPVYLTIGNISKDIRRKPSSKATVLVGYIPVSKLECFTESRRSQESHKLFHDCMRILVEPMIAAGTNGVDMVSADGYVRTAYPILAAYIADYPEQCLVACCKENSCPRCTVPPKQRGLSSPHYPPRDPTATITVINSKAAGHNPKEFADQQLRLVDPFWKDLPHCNIFNSFTPDLLHQLHKGVFKDHIFSWTTAALNGGEDVLDERFKSMTLHPDLRHFKKGVSMTTQWSGTEFKNMEKVFLGVIAGATDPEVVLAVRGVLDFIYYAHFETHSEESLAELDKAWSTFHDHKHIFEQLEIRKHFNISKLHNIKHYIDSIRTHGTADGFNTEASERLHIDLAKVAYLATNRKGFIKQMTVWLQRQSAIHWFGIYLQWAVPGYMSNGDGDGKAGEDLEDEMGDDEAVEVVEEEEVATPTMGAASRHVAKRPALTAVKLTTIVEHHGAPDFLVNLNHFMQSSSLVTSATPASESTTYSLYKRAVLTLPPIPQTGSKSVNDVVHAVKQIPCKVTRQGIKQASPARFSTVLVKSGVPSADNRSDSAPKNPLANVGVAQVRLLFKLPDVCGQCNTVLAYVHWMKPLRRLSDGVGMFEVSFSSQNHRPRASVIPLSDILQSCHLIPIFGRSMATTRRWTPGSVLSEAKTFYLNPYLRHHDFYFLRYRYTLYLNYLQEQEENAERCRAIVHGPKRRRVGK